MTTATPLAARTLGEIAAELPGATAVLRRYKLDFCCGGEETLAEAADSKGIDVAAVAAALATLTPGDCEPVPREPVALIEHILARYHEVHRRELPELVALARKVEAVHRDHPAVPAGLAAALADLAAELESHMAKEEMILFPMMRSGGNPMIGHPIARMRLEHDEHGARLHELATLTRDFILPDDACRSWQALYAGTRKLVDDLMAHIHLENFVLFPQFAPEPSGCGCQGSHQGS